MQGFSMMISHQRLWVIKYLILEYIKNRGFEKKAIDFWKLVGAVELRFGQQTRCVGWVYGEWLQAKDVDKLWQYLSLSFVCRLLRRNTPDRIKAFVSDTKESPIICEEHSNF